MEPRLKIKLIDTSSAPNLYWRFLLASGGGFPSQASLVLHCPTDLLTTCEVPAGTEINPVPRKIFCDATTTKAQEKRSWGRAGRKCTATRRHTLSTERTRHGAD